MKPKYNWKCSAHNHIVYKVERNILSENVLIHWSLPRYSSTLSKTWRNSSLSVSTVWPRSPPPWWWVMASRSWPTATGFATSRFTAGSATSRPWFARPWSRLEPSRSRRMSTMRLHFPFAWPFTPRSRSTTFGCWSTAFGRMSSTFLGLLFTRRRPTSIPRWGWTVTGRRRGATKNLWWFDYVLWWRINLGRWDVFRNWDSILGSCFGIFHPWSSVYGKRCSILGTWATIPRWWKTAPAKKWVSEVSS